MKKLMSLLSVTMLIFGASISSAAEYTSDISLSVNEKYNDNIFLSHSDRIDDFITVISPTIALTAKTEKISGRISYTPSYNYYSKHDSELSGLSHFATGEGIFNLSEKMVLTLADSFARTKDPLTIKSLEITGPTGPTAPVGPTVPVGPIKTQETLTTNTVSGNLAYRLTGQFTIRALGSYTTTDNADSASGNVNTTRVGLQPEYRLSERTTLRASVSYIFYDYQTSSNADGQEYIVGINHRLTPTLTGDVYAGVSTTHINTPDTTSTDFTGGISLTKMFETGFAVLSYVQGVIPGVESTSPLLAQEITLRYTRPATSRLDTSFSIMYAHYKSAGNIGSVEKRTDIGGSVGLAYRVLPWANATLTYSYINSDDKISSTGSYYNNTVMVGFTVFRRDLF